MNRAAATAERGNQTRRVVLSAIVAVGALSVMTQLALMREMLSTFAGNEMVFGIVLGLWLLLMGAGTMLGRTAATLTNPSAVFALALLLLSLTPLAQVFALRTLRDVVFVRGAEVGLLGTVLSTAVLLAPFCLVAGYVLVLGCAVLARANDTAGAGRVYVADSLGSIIGGVLFSFVLVHWLDHIALLCVPAVLTLATGMRLAAKTAGAIAPGRTGHHAPSYKLTHALLVIGAAAPILFLFANPDGLSTALQFRGQKILFRGNSPYGRLVVTESAAQTNFIENGVIIVSTPNIEQAEESAHYAMCQRPKAQRVLLVSGTATGAANEILKYGVTRVDCVELDPLMVDVAGRYLPDTLADPRISVFTTDGRRFVRRTTNRYDVVIIALPDPTTAQLNRFFTSEFFDEAKNILVSDGVLSFSLGRYENYLSPELGQLLASAHATLDRAFGNVLMLPAGRVYFLASDGPLDSDVASRIEQLGIQTQLVNRNYLAAMLSSDRLADMQRAVLSGGVVNRDFSPVLYYYALRHWLSQFESGTRTLQLILLVALAGYVLRLRGAAVVLFASGFAGSALEVVLLLAFQVLCGSVYHQVGIIVTLFMVGLAAGAATANKACSAFEKARTGCAQQAGAARAVNTPFCIGHTKMLALLALAVAGLALSLPILLRLLVPVAKSELGDLGVRICIGLITFFLAAVVGGQFPLANWIEAGTTTAASRLFTADFIGAFVGALLVSTFLIPVFGTGWSCLAVGALNLGAAVVLLLRKTSR